MKLTGTIRGGRRVYDSPAAAVIAERAIGEGKRFTEYLDREVQTRSEQANKRYWKVIVPLVRYYIDEDRKIQKLPPIEWPVKEKEWKYKVHDALVARHVGVDETPIGPIRKPTHTMSTPEFFALTESVARWLGEHGFNVPEEGEAMPWERTA